MEKILEFKLCILCESHEEALNSSQWQSSDNDAVFDGLKGVTVTSISTLSIKLFTVINVLIFDLPYIAVHESSKMT